MWRLYRKGERAGKLPSEILGIEDEWTAYMLDNAVLMVGTVIENALSEQIKGGTPQKPEWKSKYTIDQLLHPDFRLPRPEKPKPMGLAGLMALAGVTHSGVKKWTYQPPEPSAEEGSKDVPVES